jgi:hypothetical protein
VYTETVPERGFRFVGDVTYVAPKAGGLSITAERVETRYARSGDVNIAYQVVGSGPIDLVFVSAAPASPTVSPIKLTVEEGRYEARLIPGAEFVECRVTTICRSSASKTRSSTRSNALSEH